MPLRLRRGTNTQRAGITFEEGELIYTTDTKQVYVGDGSTPGGINLIAGASTVAPNSITIEELAVSDGVNGQVLTTDGAGNLSFTTVSGGQLETDLTPRLGGDLNLNGFNILGIGTVRAPVVGDVQGSLFADNSAILVDAISGTHFGTLIGDVNGSVFGDDSTVLVDGVNSLVTGDINNRSIVSEIIETNNMLAGDIRVGGNITNLITTVNPATTTLNLNTENTNGTIISNRPFRIGGISSGYSNGSLTIFNNSAPSSAVNIVNNVENTSSTSVSIARSRGTKASPAAVQTGDVLGAYIALGYNGVTYATAGGLAIVSTGSPDANNIPAQIDLFTVDNTGSNQVKFSVDNSGTATFTGAAQLAVYADPTARDAAIPSPSAGMTVFVTDSTGAGGAPKAQVNTDGTTGGWVDLH